MSVGESAKLTSAQLSVCERLAAVRGFRKDRSSLGCRSDITMEGVPVHDATAYHVLSISKMNEADDPQHASCSHAR